MIPSICFEIDRPFQCQDLVLYQSNGESSDVFVSKKYLVTYNLKLFANLFLLNEIFNEIALKIYIHTLLDLLKIK